MSGRFWTWTIAVWIVAALILKASEMVSTAVAMRDVGWTAGPWTRLADILSELSWPIIGLSMIATLLPAAWWRRHGGSSLGTWGLALTGPIAALSFRLIPQGYSEDAWIPFLLVAIIIAATVCSALILVLVRPKDRLG